MHRHINFWSILVLTFLCAGCRSIRTEVWVTGENGEPVEGALVRQNHGTPLFDPLERYYEEKTTNQDGYAKLSITDSRRQTARMLISVRYPDHYRWSAKFDIPDLPVTLENFEDMQANWFMADTPRSSRDMTELERSGIGQRSVRLRITD